MWLQTLTYQIKTYFRTKRHAKELNKIQSNLLENPQILLKAKENYEKQFGKDSESRNAKQWSNLVRVYGIEKVCKIEQMTEKEVKTKCVETFSQKVRKLK